MKDKSIIKQWWFWLIVILVIIVSPIIIKGFKEGITEERKVEYTVNNDYIANSNHYDKEMAENEKSNYHSDTAIGTLFEGMSICSGYTDTMSIFLNKLNIINTRIATEKHVWNAIYLDNKWLHLDLTWDDPLTSDGSDIIQYDYYLLSTDELLDKEDNEHNFNKEVYNFLK